DPRSGSGTALERDHRVRHRCGAALVRLVGFGSRARYGCRRAARRRQAGWSVVVRPGVLAGGLRGGDVRARRALVPVESEEQIVLLHRLRIGRGLRLAPRIARIPTKPVGFRLMPTQLSSLAALEAESIHIFREVAAEFEKPVLLFSGGKDSIVMARLA